MADVRGFRRWLTRVNRLVLDSPAQFIVKPSIQGRRPGTRGSNIAERKQNKSYIASGNELASPAVARHHRGMTKYLISFPSAAMVLSEAEFPIVVAESHAVIEQAKAAGVYVFGGGIDEAVDPVLVSADGSVSGDIYPGSRLNGGFCVLELTTRDEAVEWARRIAGACRCAQELREFMYDPAS